MNSKDILMVNIFWLPGKSAKKELSKLNIKNKLYNSVKVSCINFIIMEAFFNCEENDIVKVLFY